MDFKQKLSEMVKEYQRQMKVLNDGIAAINVDQRFTDVGRREKIDEITRIMQETDDNANKYLAMEISKFIEAYRPVEPTKDADYELKISNALKMIEMLGNNLTDETTSQLLDFNMDSKQLGIFRTILENRCSDSWQFHQTFKRLDNAEELLSAANRLQESAAGLFNHINPYGLSDIRVGDIEYYANVINPPAEDPANE